MQEQRGITEADVRRSVTQLVKEGRVPSPSNVRLELGRGSYSTIGRLLKIVMEKRLREHSAPPLSDALRGKANDMLQAVWQEACTAASTKTEEIREDYEISVTKLKQDIASREDELDRLQFEVVQLQGALREEEHTTLALRQRVAEMELEVHALAAVVQEQREERNSLLTRLQQLSAQLSLPKAA